MNNKSALPLSTEKFYDAASEFYEQMIDFEKNLRLRTEAYKNIFQVRGSAADLGGGIGLDSIALAVNGHKVTAFDISPKMIEATKLNAKKYNVTVDAQTHSIFSLPKKYKNKFNSVVCVGNTIAHLNSKELDKAFKQIYDLLLPGGKVFLHILNYEMIHRQNRRINNIAKRGGKTIIRFYDFYESYIMFNILTFEDADTKKFQLITTKHFPHTQKEILLSLKKCGFLKQQCFSNFAGAKYHSKESKDLFIAAIK